MSIRLRWAASAVLSAALLLMVPTSGRAATHCAAPKHAGISALSSTHVRCATARKVSRKASKKIDQRGEGFGSAVRVGRYVCAYRWPTTNGRHQPLHFRVTCTSDGARVAFTRRVRRAG
jgi:hypothetical protein